MPLKNEEVFAHKQMNEIVNEDTLEYNHKYYYSIRNFLNNMLIVMPDSTALKTSSDIEKSSFGLNLNEYILNWDNPLTAIVYLWDSKDSMELLLI